LREKYCGAIKFINTLEPQVQTLTEEIKMLDKILSFIKPMSYHSILESYICSRNPQNAADIERLTQDFNRITARGSWL